MLDDWRLLAFASALFLYALWGAPTPNNPGVLEAAVAGLLFVALCSLKIIQQPIFSILEKKEYWKIALTFLFLYGVTIPVLGALIQGAELTLVLRDIVGFVFLCLPVFLISFLVDNKPRQRVLLFSILIIGFLFSLRVLFPSFFIFKETTELLYLANSPLVLFSALYLVFLSCQKLFVRLKGVNVLFFITGIIAASIMLMAMFVDLQRASFIALFISSVVLFIIGFIKAPRRVLLPLCCVVLLLLVISPAVLGILEGIQAKTSKVGLNMRLQELYAIWDVMQSSVWGMLFGQGWGSSFASPAVGGLHVTYSHSLLSYMFFKSGLIGLGLTLVYLFFLFEKLVRLYFTDPVKGNALMWPLLIPVFLYASHKSFDFGLLLTLILVLTSQKKETVS